MTRSAFIHRWIPNKKNSIFIVPIFKFQKKISVQLSGCMPIDLSCMHYLPCIWDMFTAYWPIRIEDFTLPYITRGKPLVEICRLMLTRCRSNKVRSSTENNNYPIIIFQWKMEIYFISWTLDGNIFTRGKPLVKICRLMLTRRNKFRSSTENNKYPIIKCYRIV